MKDSLNSLLEIVKKNVAVCEWCNTQTSDMHLVKLKEEITELELAIKIMTLKTQKKRWGMSSGMLLILATFLSVKQSLRQRTLLIM